MCISCSYFFFWDSVNCHIDLPVKNYYIVKSPRMNTWFYYYYEFILKLLNFYVHCVLFFRLISK